MTVMKNLILVLFSIFSLASAAISKEGNVLVLDDDNFEEALALHDQLLVEFYAPWCGHCKSLAPEWAKAGDTLKDSPIKLAKVDATVATDLAKEYGIKGFPTIKFIKNGKASDYSGGRTEKDIVSWVSKKAGPAAKTISTEAELLAFREANEAAVLGVFSSADSANARVFVSLADSDDDNVYAISTSEEVRASLALQGDTVVVLKSFDELRSDLAIESFDTAAVKTFILKETTPLVQEFSKETSSKIFKSPITKHALIFTAKGTEQHALTFATVSPLSKIYRGQLLFVSIPANADNQRVLDFFDLKASDLPKIILADMNPEGGNMKKFPYSGEITEEGVSDFISSFLAGTLQPALKSEEPVPADTEGDVVVVKGKSFNSIVFDNTHDVLIEFYAPWCGHCKQLAPTWDALGKKFKSNPNIVIAKIDATANEIDHPALAVKGFPSIFFVKGDSKIPVKYDGGRELDDLVAYINKNAHNKVDNATAGDDDDDHDEL